MSNELRNFLALSYDELEELNLKAKDARKSRTPVHKVQEDRLKYLTDEKRVKAVTVMFSDLEGRLHMLDYDKKFLLKSYDNLTFDGSSIRGFTAQKESDLRLHLARQTDTPIALLDILAMQSPDLEHQAVWQFRPGLPSDWLTDRQDSIQVQYQLLFVAAAYDRRWISCRRS